MNLIALQIADQKNFFRHFLTVFFSMIFILYFCTPASAQIPPLPREIQDAQFYFLVDADTKEILLSKNADVRIAPSSMTKLMTAYVVFDQVKKGKISLTNQCLIGKDAWRKSGSSMFLNYGDVVTIDDLVKGLLAVSGNDAAIALAESVGSGMDNFVALMNLKAREIGLKNSHFKNPHGLNEEGHYMSLRDLATLATHIYEEFPQYASYFSIPEFTYHNIKQQNRNPLIREHYDGTVGGKTGYTNDGGYGVIGIVKRDHRRLIAVVNKAKTPKQRMHILTSLLDYGFNNYKKLIIFESGQQVSQLAVWLGTKSKVNVATNQRIAFNMPRETPLSQVRVSVKYMGPLYAPVTKNAKVATLVIEVKGYKTFEYSLYARERVEKVGDLRKIKRVLEYKFHNFFNKNFK